MTTEHYAVISNDEKISASQGLSKWNNEEPYHATTCASFCSYGVSV